MYAAAVYKHNSLYTLYTVHIYPETTLRAFFWGDAYKKPREKHKTSARISSVQN